MLRESEIKKLIEKGFDIELISFEFDIPFEYVKKCQLELKNNKQDIKEYRITDKEDSKKNAHSRMEKMREKYRKLTSQSNGDKKQEKVQSEQEAEFIETIAIKLENKIEEFRKFTKEEKRRNVKEIFTLLNNLEDYTLTIEQAEKIMSLMDSTELKGLSFSMGDAIDIHIEHRRQKIGRKLAKAIDLIQTQTEDIEELKSLNKKLPYEMGVKDKMVIGAVKERISNKILNLNQKQAISRIRNNVSESLQNVITDLAQGTLDIESTNAIIEEEAKKRVEGKPKTLFSLTEEQEKRQILIQIRTVLAEQADKYHIENPMITIAQLQALCGGEIEQAIKTVVNNITISKDFETARQICDIYISQNKESNLYRPLQILKREVRSAEISGFVLNGLKNQQTPEEDSAYISLIEREMRLGNIRMEAISLGQSHDGKKNITLADVWSDENQKQK